MARRPPKPDPVGPGQESVWDYPRPPALEPTPQSIRVIAGGVTVAETASAYRLLETSHPPTYYLPPADVRTDLLERAGGSSFCEWKGMATYWTLALPSGAVARCAWSYESPSSRYAAIADYLAFYLPLMDACYVGDEPARPQPGGFYGGWITSDLAGPFKGDPGTEWW